MATYNAFPEANINDVGSTSSTHPCFGYMISSTDHDLVGESIQSVTFKMHMQTASSSTNPVYCRLYQSDGTLVHTFGSITESGIGTTATKYTFSSSLPSSVSLHQNHIFVIESSAYDNIKIAQRDEDVSPYGHRARGASGSSFTLDTGKDVWFSVEYGASSGGSGASGEEESGGSSGTMYTSSGSTPHNENRPLRIFKSQRSWF